MTRPSQAQGANAFLASLEKIQGGGKSASDKSETKTDMSQAKTFYDPYDPTGTKHKTNSPVTTPASSSPGKWTKRHIGYVAAVHPDGTSAGRWEVLSDNEDWWIVAEKVFPVVDGEMRIPIDLCNLSYESVSFNACTFTATEDYLASRWGRKLHYSDRDWLALHPFATDQGIPFEYTATAVQQLVEPYGMRVSRMRVRRGSLAAGPENTKWMMALGCNPFAMVDHQTSNAEFAAKSGMPLAEVDKLFRYEFSDEPLKPAIIGEKGWTSSSGISVGNAGGHARYIAPRQSAGDWAVSLQLDMADQVSYLVNPELPEYKPRKGKAKMDLGKVIRPDGKKLAVIYCAYYYSPEDAERLKDEDKYKPSAASKSSTEATGSKKKPSTGSEATTSTGATQESLQLGEMTPQTSDTPPAPSASGSSSESSPKTGETDSENSSSPPVCAICGKETAPRNFEPDTDVCAWCWGEAWEGITCNKCGTTYTAQFNPEPTYRDANLGVTYFACPSKSCDSEFELHDNQEKDYPDLVAIAVNVYDSWDGVEDVEQEELDAVDGAVDEGADYELDEEEEDEDDLDRQYDRFMNVKKYGVITTTPKKIKDGGQIDDDNFLD